MGQPRTRAYHHGKLDGEDFPLDDVSEQLARDDTYVWVDLVGPTRDDLAQLADELGLHDLAVEDALEPHQRPKLDHYPTHQFLSCHAVQVADDAGGLEKTEIDAFISKRWLVTVREPDRFFDMGKVVDRWDTAGDLAAHGVSFLVYGLLDIVVDGYFDAVQAFDDFYDEISESIFDEKPLTHAQQEQWFDMRRALMRFHRLGVPLREAISALMRREHTTVPEEMYPYYQDVYDHILRVSDETDSLRDLVSTIVETNLSLRDFRQNEIVKKVSGWAAVVAVPALITGYFGMNVPFPGSERSSGFWLASGILVGMSTSLYLAFRRRDWL
jgi:magnesium transporter